MALSDPIPIKISDFSTNYDSRYNLINIAPIYELEIGDDKIIFSVDVLDHKLTRLINSIQDYFPYIYDGQEHITTISYKAYNTTTLYWLIVMYNGIMHPLEIEPGLILKIPKMTEVSRFFQEASAKRNKGRIVEI
jgi:hypothetical protein